MLATAIVLKGGTVQILNCSVVSQGEQEGYMTWQVLMPCNGRQVTSTVT